jgi:hypothetical protein
VWKPFLDKAIGDPRGGQNGHDADKVNEQRVDACELRQLYVCKHLRHILARSKKGTSAQIDTAELLCCMLGVHTGMPHEALSGLID